MSPYACGTSTGASAFYTGKLGFAEMLRLDHEDGRLMLIYLRITDQQYLDALIGFWGGRLEQAERNVGGSGRLRGFS